MAYTISTVSKITFMLFYFIFVPLHDVIHSEYNGSIGHGDSGLPGNIPTGY